MKRHILLLALSACFNLNAAETSTNLLSISLVDDKVFLSRMPVKTTNASDMKIIYPSVLADKDFVAVDTANQTFTITPEAAKRLAGAIWSLGKNMPLDGQLLPTSIGTALTT
ncbi:MAG: hypothetical protein ABSH38_05455 [Verrucomicrobiota bacterium]|jgi:hypothetical protein